jgi:type II secretory pathway pseudopilin PulG
MGLPLKFRAEKKMVKRIEKMRKKMFTLVEIVLALMVTAVGIIGVMALFPVGLQKNKESISNRSAADAADQFLHSAVAKIGSDWETHNAFPLSISVADESDIFWSRDNWIESSNVDVKFSTINETDSFDYTINNTGMFRIAQITPGNITDFTAVIRSWKELVVVGDPRLNGDIMPWAVLEMNSDVGRGFDYGEEYVIKYNAGSSVTPGNFGCVNFSGGGGGGASQYQDYIANGGIEASVGDQFYPQTGNMVGPTVNGVNSRLAVTPYIRIPVVSSFPNGSSQQVIIVEFLPFKLVAVSGHGNSGATVKAVYIGEDNNGDGVEATSEKLTLKAEISWPYHLPYSARQKEIYSLMMFKAGHLNSIGINPY